MGEIVNLRTHRKRALRLRQDAIATENRATHGQSKADRSLDEARRDKAGRELDQHRIETGDDR